MIVFCARAPVGLHRAMKLCGEKREFEYNMRVGIVEVGYF